MGAGDNLTIDHYEKWNAISLHHGLRHKAKNRILTPKDIQSFIFRACSNSLHSLLRTRADRQISHAPARRMAGALPPPPVRALTLDWDSRTYKVMNQNAIKTSYMLYNIILRHYKIYTIIDMSSYGKYQSID